MEKKPVLPEELLNNIRTRLPVREIFQTSLVCKRWAQVCKSSHFCDQVCSHIPIVDVDGNILAKVIEYCMYHAEARTWSGDKAATAEDEIKAWDQEFMKVDQATVFGLLRAADYLNVRSLVDLTCQSVADMLTGKSVEELRHILGITNDFTPEEEEEVRRQNQWAFD